MRRPVDVKAHSCFFLSVILFPFSQAASVAILPSALFSERISLTKECGWKDGDRGGLAEGEQNHGKKKARVCLDINWPSHGKELWGTWVVRREVPTTTISCWGDKEAKKLIGTEIEYSAQIFRWNKTVTKNPTAETITITAQRF